MVFNSLDVPYNSCLTFSSNFSCCTPPEDYFNSLAGVFENSTGKFSFDKKYVIETMDEAVVAQSPPPRMIVGMDAKYFLYPFSKLPTSFRVNFIRKKPAMMMK